jgi:hypothetical protein
VCVACLPSTCTYTRMYVHIHVYRLWEAALIDVAFPAHIRVYIYTYAYTPLVNRLWEGAEIGVGCLPSAIRDYRSAVMPVYGYMCIRAFYVCMCVPVRLPLCGNARIRACPYKGICVYAHIYVCMCVRVRLPLCGNARIWVCVYARIFMSVCVCVCDYRSAVMPVYGHMCIRAYLCLYVCACATTALG